MTILPKSKLGKWSLGLVALFIAGMGVFFLMAYVFNQKGGEYIYSNLALFLPILLAALGAVSSLFTGVISFFASKERGLLVFLSVLIGLLVTVYLVMEFAFVH